MKNDTAEGLADVTFGVHVGKELLAFFVTGNSVQDSMQVLCLFSSFYFKNTMGNSEKVGNCLLDITYMKYEPKNVMSSWW